MKTNQIESTVCKGTGKKTSTRHFTILPGLLAAAMLLCAPGRATAASFTINSSSSTAQSLGSSETGSVTSAGTLSTSNGSQSVAFTGNNATLTNSGTIKNTSNGRVLRDNTGVTGLTITNNAGALMQAADADVFQMNVAGGGVTLTNSGTMISINASKGGAQVIDFAAMTSGSNIVNNTSTGVMLAAEADVVRTGVNGIVNNAGTIKVSANTPGNSSDAIDAQNNSGARIFNDTTGLIEGARHGITGGALNSSVTFTMTGTNKAGGIIKGDDGAGMNIDGFNANETVTFVNNGTITGNGVTADGDGIDVDGVINLTNTGLIKSINSVSGTSVAQSEGVTVGGGTITNSGTIEGDVAVGNTNAVGRGITIAGVDTSGTPEHIYTNTTITNSGLIKGQSDSGIAIQGGTSGFSVTITNQAGGLIEGGGTNSAAIQGNNDNTTITNSGTIMADSSNKAIVFGSGSNSLTISGSGAAVIGNIIGGSGTNNLIINPGAGNSFSYAGSISNFNSAKIQSGTVTFSGSNTYTGPTTVSGAKLVVNGSIKNSAVTVNSGGTLGGGGITGSININGGGALAPGNSPGIITAPSLSINSGSTANGGGQYRVEIVATGSAPFAGASYDQTVLTGTGSILSLDKTASTGAVLTLTISGSLRSSGIASASNPYSSTGSNTSLDNYFILNLQDSGALRDAVNNRFAVASDGTNYVAIDYDTNRFSGNNPNQIGTFTLNGQEWALSYVGNFASNATTGGNDVVITAIPEPRTWLMMICGFGMLLVYQRKRARKTLRA